MRVSPVGFAFQIMQKVLAWSKRSASHDRPTYGFDETCQGTVPRALAAFFESTSYEDAIRNAISLGAMPITLACIAGGIA